MIVPCWMCLLILLLLEWAPKQSQCLRFHGHGVRSAMQTQRFAFQESFYRAPSGLFNPAGTYSSSHGWVVLFRWDKCCYSQCGVMETESQVVAAYLGHAVRSPDMDNAAKYSEVLRFEESGYRELLTANAAEKLIVADLRPFVWNEETYASGWIKAFGRKIPSHHRCWRTFRLDPFPMTCEYTALFKLDFAGRLIRPVYQFRFPIIGNTYRPEKNWGFLVKDGQLLVLHSILPCLTVFQVASDFHSGASLRHAFCHTKPDKVYRGSGHVLRSSRISGHPIPYAQEETPEYMTMVHARSTVDGYRNWIVRLDGESLRPTHISAGPVLKGSSFHTEGYMPATLVVGSFHIVEGVAGEEVLRMLFGEGDQYSGWEDVRLKDVAWHAFDQADIVQLSDEKEILQYSGEVGQPL